MDKTRKILIFAFLLPVVLSGALAVVYELELLLPGNLAGNATVEVIGVGAMELITICLIPVALRLFRSTSVRRLLQQHPAGELRRWGLIRIAMIGLPVLINTWLYYQTLNVAPGYLAIIGLLAMFFIYPSAARCQQDTTAQ